MKKIILTTGGTGGHVFPALAVAQEIKDRCPDCEILFIGGQGPEKEMVQRAGLEFKALPAKGIVGGGIKKILSSGWIVKSFLLAMKEIKAFRPDAIIGFGGYAGFCPVLAGRVLGIPTAIHEQNSVPGVTNRILGKVVNKIFASFENTAGAFPAGKIEVTGNPVRKEIFRCGRSANGKTVLVVGGSQGAHPINRALVAALPKFKDAGVTLNHQTGKADYDEVCAEYEKAGMNPAQVSVFIHDMACAYAQAQLVICRAGASTVFEIAAAGKPAVFIPFPQATHDHQTGNAMNLAKIGAALVIPQGELSGDALADQILELISDQEKLTEMGSKALSFARPDAASAIVDGILNIIRMKRGAA